MKITLLALIIAILPASLATGQESEALQQAIEDGRSTLAAKAVSVAIVDADGKLETFVSGEAAQGVPVTPDTLFQIGSVTKTFTAAVILQLVESGTISLDAKLTKWYPDLPEAKTITVQQLLNHTSGLNDPFQEADFSKGLLMNGGKSWTISQVLKKVGSPNFDPGSQWSYCSSGYIALAGVAEKVSGKSLAKLFREQLFEPIELKEIISGGFEESENPIAHGFIDIFGDEAEEDLSALVSMKGFLTASGGAGGLVASPRDVARFYHALFNDKFFPKQRMLEWTNRKDGNQHGLGVLKLTLDGVELIGHRGNTGGFSCSAWHLPELGKTIVTCSNKNGIHMTEIVKRILIELKRE